MSDQSQYYERIIGVDAIHMQVMKTHEKNVWETPMHRMTHSQQILIIFHPLPLVVDILLLFLPAV